ncbi:unnamed protein product [Caenorhabditis bovis]|uniref:Lipoprotein n=1 Tax=Caenorhabditis bovis TaxID=2654633 RepID=A0A8S1EHD5_9PELO|nr:unnamed protein product [Caenorhabditis bovis]
MRSKFILLVLFAFGCDADKLRLDGWIHCSLSDRQYFEVGINAYERDYMFLQKNDYLGYQGFIAEAPGTHFFTIFGAQNEDEGNEYYTFVLVISHDCTSDRKRVTYTVMDDRYQCNLGHHCQYTAYVNITGSWGTVYTNNNGGSILYLK